jgi:hypothetical protein
MPPIPLLRPLLPAVAARTGYRSRTIRPPESNHIRFSVTSAGVFAFSTSGLRDWALRGRGRRNSRSEIRRKTGPRVDSKVRGKSPLRGIFDLMDYKQNSRPEISLLSLVVVRLGC